MASVEGNPGSADGEQAESATVLEDLPLILKETTAPLNFCTLAPHHFGISTQSFTPAKSSNRKDKSLLAQIKARRRSNIGARGSPETNSLIRFMAQNRMKTPPLSKTPEPVKCSPFLPRVASTLKQKMASFQHLMDAVDAKPCDPAPSLDSDAAGRVETRGYLSDGRADDGEKENRPSAQTAVQCGGRHTAPPEACRLQIRKASAPVLHSGSEKGGLLEDFAAPNKAPAVLVPSPLPAASKLPACSIPESQQEGDFELTSLSQPPPDGAAAAAAAPPSSHQLTTLSSDSEMKPAETDPSAADFRPKKKKKSVRFGVPLSPELFDKRLPPSTPLQKGGTPARAPTPGGALRSALKTTPVVTRPDLDVPSAFGASPVLKMPRNHRMASLGEDEDGQIFPQTIEEIEAEMTGDEEYLPDAQPLNLNNAFHEESEVQSRTEAESEAVGDSQTDERTSVPEEQQQQQPEAKEEPLLRRKPSRKRPAPEGGAPAEAPNRSSSRKRKHPLESELVKRSKRSSAEVASGKIKSSVVMRRWSKDVDRSLYSSRAYASKNPVLSPITESLSFSGGPPSTSSAGSEVTLQTSEGPSEDKVPPGEVNNLLEQEVGDPSAEHREESPPAEQDGGQPETLTGTTQDVEKASRWAATAPTSDSRSPAPKKAKKGRRSSTHRPELNLLVEQQRSFEVEEKKVEEQRDSVSSGTGSQEEEAGLAAWQSDFDCEDVFRPVARAGSRSSVRRSLRIRGAGAEGGGQGLAWLPPSPTHHAAESHRRARGRRRSSSSSQPL